MADGDGLNRGGAEAEDGGRRAEGGGVLFSFRRVWGKSKASCGSEKKKRRKRKKRVGFESEGGGFFGPGQQGWWGRW
jgi:hypothetical protein